MRDWVGICGKYTKYCDIGDDALDRIIGVMIEMKNKCMMHESVKEARRRKVDIMIPL